MWVCPKVRATSCVRADREIGRVLREVRWSCFQSGVHANALGTQLEGNPAAGGELHWLLAADGALCNLVEGGSADLVQVIKENTCKWCNVRTRR